MLDRRQTLSLLRLGWTGPMALAEPASQSQIPELSKATLGSVVAAGWSHQTLPKVERANNFSIVADDGSHVLEVHSSSSASSWVTSVDVDSVQCPILQWRWKISKSLAGSDLRTKQGDDDAARPYVLFDLLPYRLRIQTARMLSGAAIPTAAVCYVWGHAQPVEGAAWNPYTDRVRMNVVDRDDTHALQWRSIRRNVRVDWAEAFGGEAPGIIGIAMGSDIDNTRDSVDTWFSDMRFAPMP
jgi:Protein of unknown function (DUF3047)